MTPDDERIRGIAAQRIISDPLVIEAFEKMETSVIDTLKNTSNLLPEDLERLWIMLRMVGKFRSAFESIVASGKMAEFELNKRK